MTKIDALHPPIPTPKAIKREQLRRRQLEDEESRKTMRERLDRLYEQVRAEKAQKEKEE